MGFWVFNKKPSRAPAKPLNDLFILGAVYKCVDSIQRIGRAAAGFTRLRPLVNQRKRQPHFCRDLLGIVFLNDITQDFVRMHI